jgi:DNA primase
MYTGKWVDVFPEWERESIVVASKNTLASPKGVKALDYLMNVRKLSRKTIDDFDIGYCPRSANHQVYGRIITPIYDAYKNLVAVSTRTPYPSKLRFWHEHFDKGSHLYGLHLAKQSITRSNKVILVEGEFDVASLHSNGFNMTVGVCGSALTLFQIALLSKYTSRFYIMFDGDEPGLRAKERAREMYNKYFLKSYNIHFIYVDVPEKLDPDDFVKKYGPKGLKKILIEARDKYDLLI